MAATESWEMIERWKAEHPDLANGAPSRPAPRPRLVPEPSPEATRTEQQALIERWRQEHPQLPGLPAPVPIPAVRTATPSTRARDDARPVFDFAQTPMSILSAFVVGCILGGIAMTIITGIAFWGFSSG